MAEPAVDLATDPKAASAAGRAFARVMDLWRATPDEAASLAGLGSAAAFETWRRGDVAALTDDQLTRASYILGIYKALQIVFLDASQADAWVSKPNDAFGGRSAKQRMLDRGADGMAEVRGYLDHVRGGLS